MELEPNHPFEVLILEDIPSDGNKSFAINSGKIINFHNPLNYRNVKCDSGGVFLPNLPYSIKNPDTNEDEEIEIKVIIPTKTTKKIKTKNKNNSKKKEDKIIDNLDALEDELEKKLNSL